MRGRQLATATATALAVAASAVLLASCGGGWPPLASAQSITSADRALLVSLRNSTTNWEEFATANNISGWYSNPGTAGVPTCLWTGVMCDGDARLTSVLLQCPDCQVKAEGTLPPQLGQLTGLITLNLQQNNLTGPLPPEYGAPGAFSSLLNLVLQQNQLTGSVPEEWAGAEAFPRLSVLGLGFNRLTGTLPADLALPSLLILRIQGNSLTGPLPAQWGTNTSLPRLRVASLHENSFSGRLPAEWAREWVMQEMEEMYLQENQLTGGLPAAWGSWQSSGWPMLRVLNLSGNPLRGTLPYEWSRQQAFPSLRNL